MLARIWRNWNPDTFLVEVQNGIAKDKNMAPQEVEHGIAIWPSNCTSRYKPKRIEKNDQVTTCT